MTAYTAYTAYTYRGTRVITRDFTLLDARKRKAPRCMCGDCAVITGGYQPDNEGGRYVYDVLYAC